MPVLLAAWSLIRAHWRPAAVAALALACLVAGRCSAPKSKTITVTQVQWKERVVTQVVEKKVEQKDEVKTMVVYRDRVTHKDGTVEDKTETHETVGIEDRNTDNVSAQQIVVASGAQKTTTVKTSDAPRLHVAALIGSPLSPTGPELVVGAAADYRILGPITVGAWMHVDPSNKSLNPVGGLSFGVTF